MSKAQFKKELAGLEKEQLVEMMVDLYSRRKDFKEYFEFFLNPDVKKLTAKYHDLISKELERVKRGARSKARISVIKTLLKDFASFQPGFESEIDMGLFVMVYALSVEKRIWFTPTLEKGIAKILCDTVELADRNNVTAETLKRVAAILDGDAHGSRYFRTFLKDTLSGYLAASASKIGKG